MQETDTRVDRLKDDILNGPIIKTLLVLGWPVIVSNALQMLYNLVDTYWLGKIGKEAVAAPTVGFPVVFLLISLALASRLPASRSSLSIPVREARKTPIRQPDR